MSNDRYPDDCPAPRRSLDPDGDSIGKEKAKRGEKSIQKTVEDLNPYLSGDLGAARVIEQVEMHYESVRASFTGYVAALVVEQKIMGQLANNVLITTLIRDIDEQMVNRIAGERPDHAKKRIEIENNLDIMRGVMKAMEEYQKEN
ncbi:hypothetical protein RRF57_008826 [Xylaria bambusicola]|uniref:GED domain-containing protein n=1 Tax=Xylaria bambusicola TaxID=326684 RepID=A0AAN7Z8L4_9PEZI